MHEIILILLIIAISTIPTGFFIRYDIPEDKKIEEPTFVKKKTVSKKIVDNADTELDMEMFNELSSDVQSIIMKYLD